MRTIHLQVVGHAPDGRPYAASDPQLLTWVHVAEVSSFLAAHLRYKNPDLSPRDQDRYYSEIALVAEQLGARHVPRSRQEISDYLQRIRPQLLCDERSHEVLRLLLNAPAPSTLAKPFGALMMQAGIDLLPGWASDMLGQQQSPLQRQLIRAGVKRSAAAALGNAQWFGAEGPQANGPAVTTQPLVGAVKLARFNSPARRAPCRP